tara:strand:+ start:664 stop:867 length:204 start_codon:yes stop_codon:yes gene_type:complete
MSSRIKINDDKIINIVEQYNELILEILNWYFLYFKKIPILKIVYTFKNKANIKNEEPIDDIIVNPSR